MRLIILTSRYAILNSVLVLHNYIGMTIYTPPEPDIIVHKCCHDFLVYGVTWHQKPAS